MQTTRVLQRIAPLVIAALLAGCGGNPGSGESEATVSGSKTPMDAVSEPDPEALAVLAKADSFDGKEDGIISKCLTCSLAMAGDARHASKFGSYELHLCSEACKEHFDAEPEKAVLAAKLPASLR